MKRVSIAEVISALELEIAAFAVLIGSSMDPLEIARMYKSDAQSDEEALDLMKKEHKIIIFFDLDSCPVLAGTLVDLYIDGQTYIVKLI
jgi:hypothetical protein